MNRLFRLLIPTCLFLLTVPLEAGYPRRWIASTAADFARGDGRGISITSDGRLILAPGTEELLDTGEAIVHDALLDVSGNLYLATGGNGKIFRVGVSGTAGEWATLSESSVFALAADSSNRIYAATSPDGKVYRIDAQGQPQLFFDPGEKYIWALAFDRDNNLFVATGPRGIIYRVSPDGRSSTFHDTAETHVVSLAWDIEGRLVAGTATGGLLYRFAADGTPFVLLDSPLQEIKAVTVDSYGNLFAAALSGGTSSAEDDLPESEEGPEDESVESTVTVSTGAEGGRLQIYRVDRSGRVATIYSSPDQLAYDLAVRPDGTVLAGIGDRGRILSISPDRAATLLVDTDEQQVTQLLERAGTLYAATANLGKVLRISARPAESGAYESEVLDAGMSARWGTLRWTLLNAAADTPSFSTRSGNTATPDETWSDWSEPSRQSEGAAIRSPTGRYLQWKVELPASGRSDALLSDSNAVDQVSVSYMQENAAPVLAELKVHAPSLALVDPPRANPPGGLALGGPEGAHASSLPPQTRKLEDTQRTIPPRKTFVPGARSLSWQATDANEDELRYRVEYRHADESRWVLLADDLARNHFTIDGASLPDGQYFARVTVTDGPSNPPSETMRASLISKPFIVASAAPQVEWGSVSATSVAFTATTTATPIFQVEYAVDGGPWQIVYPEDGIADSAGESYMIALPDLASGSHTIAVRVVDTVANVSTAATRVTVP